MIQPSIISLFSKALALFLLFHSQCFAQNEIVERHAWTGRIGENIPVKVWVEVRADGLAAGELVYTKTGSGKPIIIIGSLGLDNIESYERTLFLTEYQPDGYNSGYFDGEIDDDGTFSGNWSVIRNTSQGTKSIEFTMTLDQVIPFPTDRHSLLRPATLEEIGGEYSYSFISGGGGDRGGFFDVKRDDKAVRFSIDVNNPNLASTSNSDDENPTKLDGNKFSYIMKDCDYGFECEFFKDFVFIRNLGKASSDCFGAYTTLSGSYIKQQTEPEPTVTINQSFTTDVFLKLPASVMRKKLSTGEYRKTLLKEQKPEGVTFFINNNYVYWDFNNGDGYETWEMACYMKSDGKNVVVIITHGSGLDGFAMEANHALNYNIANGTFSKIELPIDAITFSEVVDGTIVEDKEALSQMKEQFNEGLTLMYQFDTTGFIARYNISLDIIDDFDVIDEYSNKFPKAYRNWNGERFIKP